MSIRFNEGNVLIQEVNFPKELDERLNQLRHDDVKELSKAIAQK